MTHFVGPAKSLLLMWMPHLISVRLHIHRPLVCVPILFSFLSKVAGNIPKHNRLHNSHSLQPTERIQKFKNRHDNGTSGKYRSTEIESDHAIFVKLSQSTLNYSAHCFKWHKITKWFAYTTLECGVSYVTLTRPPESGPNSVIFLNILQLKQCR